MTAIKQPLDQHGTAYDLHTAIRNATKEVSV